MSEVFVCASRRFVVRIAGVTVIASLHVGPLEAQSTTPPFRPVFGAARTERTDPSEGRLDVLADVSLAYDDDVYADFGGVTPISPRVAGFYTVFSPTLDFQKPGEKLQVGISGRSNIRYYRDTSRVLTSGNAVGAGLTARLGQQTFVSVNQGVTYSPAYLYTLLAPSTTPSPGDTVPPASDYNVVNPPSYAYSTTGTVTRNASPRTSFVLDADFRFSDFSERSLFYSDLRSYGAAGRAVQSVSRNFKLRLGYAYRSAEYSPEFVPTEHGPDLGVDYAVALSQTRRMSFGVTIGPRLLNRSSAQAVTSGRELGFTGDANVSYQLKRTWTSEATFRRGLDFVEGLREPVVTNGVTGRIGGFLNRRTDVSLLTAGSMGESYAGAPFRTATADVRIRFAVNHVVAANFGYLFYYYDFDKSYELPPGVSSRLTRNGVRVGLTFWAPVRP